MSDGGGNGHDARNVGGAIGAKIAGVHSDRRDGLGFGRRRHLRAQVRRGPEPAQRGEHGRERRAKTGFEHGRHLFARILEEDCSSATSVWGLRRQVERIYADVG